MDLRGFGLYTDTVRVLPGFHKRFRHRVQDFGLWEGLEPELWVCFLKGASVSKVNSWANLS